jgi:hypothetical protein
VIVVPLTLIIGAFLERSKKVTISELYAQFNNSSCNFSVIVSKTVRFTEKCIWHNFSVRYARKCSLVEKHFMNYRRIILDIAAKLCHSSCKMPTIVARFH